MKVVAPARAVAEVDGLSGRRYKARDGIYDMSKRDAKALVKAGGFLPSLSGTTARATGWRCPACTFGSFFRRCSRCGGDCEREG
ncbi:MAG: hypothetical protein ACRDP6_16495 [Actinoallomurus sp.]